jgi:hypothetical protein
LLVWSARVGQAGIHRGRCLRGNAHTAESGTGATSPRVTAASEFPARRLPTGVPSLSQSTNSSYGQGACPPNPPCHYQRLRVPYAPRRPAEDRRRPARATPGMTASSARGGATSTGAATSVRRLARVFGTSTGSRPSGFERRSVPGRGTVARSTLNGSSLGRSGDCRLAEGRFARRRTAMSVMRLA